MKKILIIIMFLMFISLVSCNKVETTLLTTKNTSYLPLITKNHTVTYSKEESSNWIIISSDRCSYTYLTINGQIVFPFLFDYAYPFIDGSSVVRLNGLEALIDYNGNYLIPFKYVKLTRINNSNLIQALDELGSVYLYDDSGNLIIDNSLITEYKEYSNNYLIAKTNENYGVINLNHETIIPFEYKSINLIKDNYFALLSDNETVSVVSLTNNEIFSISSSINLDFNQDDLSIFKQNNLYGLVNLEGDIILEPIYNEAVFSKNDSFLFKANSSQKIISPRGEIIFNTDIYNILDYNDNFIIVNDSNKNHYIIDYQGNIKFESLNNTFEIINDLNGDFVILENIIETDKIISQKVYDSNLNLISDKVYLFSSKNFNEERQAIVVYKDFQPLVINYNGETILDLENISKYYLYPNYILVETIDKHFGLYNYLGEEIIKPIYSSICCGIMDK
ncbi:MAG: hypothetical protein B6I17_03645 [Tenericutes bacterium 4572_104]|nr:MAG: hypothetical protein B6I17_03645 [Tenericutes bacterium 4572_104]